MPLKNDLLVRAARCQPVERTPVWMMRQAGRYLPEYRAVRKDLPFLTLCKTVDLAVEVSLQPLRILGVDAVIMFSDILIPVEAMGLEVQLTEKIGPKMPHPVRSAADVEALRVPDPVETMPFVYDIIRTLKREIADAVPLLGFAGAPWTLAAYMIEGGSSKNYHIIKSLMYSEPAVFHRLMEKLADTQALYLKPRLKLELTPCNSLTRGRANCHQKILPPLPCPTFSGSLSRSGRLCRAYSTSTAAPTCSKAWPLQVPRCSALTGELTWPRRYSVLRDGSRCRGISIPAACLGRARVSCVASKTSVPKPRMRRVIS
jgi:hypothetical protein